MKNAVNARREHRCCGAIHNETFKYQFGETSMRVNMRQRSEKATMRIALFVLSVATVAVVLTSTAQPARADHTFTAGIRYPIKDDHPTWFNEKYSIGWNYSSSEEAVAAVVKNCKKGNPRHPD